MRRVCVFAALAMAVGCGGRGDLGGSAPDGGPGQGPVADAAAETPTMPEAGDGADAASQEASNEPSGLEASTDVLVDEALGEAMAAGDAPADAPVDAVIHAPAEAATPDATYPRSCDDNRLDGDETDVDCGGSCPPCGLAQACLVASDCGSSPGCDPARGGCACDAVTHTCVYDHCSDHTKDSTETDVDCGGADCAACLLNQACLANTDCSYTLAACQVTGTGCFCDGVSLTCVYSHCVDHKKDVYESGIDCGGGCAGCAVGQGCVYNWDCASNVCDVNSALCVASQCFDERKDGAESDIDCGGACAGCGAGKNCNTSADCASAYTCTTGVCR